MMRILASLLLILLGGCSALSEQQCRVGDWYTLGYQDGVNGKGKERLASYREACSEYGVVPDPARWQSGYDKGLAYYCLPELAYAKGKSGEEYHGVCPNDASFLANYQRGRREYQIQQAFDELRNRLDHLYEERDRLWRNYRHTDDEAARRELRYRLDRLDWMEMDLRHQLLDVQRLQLK